MVNVEFAERPFDVSLRAVVLSSAERITAGKSRPKLIISHRFPTVRVADLSVVLENGRVVESGSHAKLMNGGHYAELYNLQAAQYRSSPHLRN